MAGEISDYTKSYASNLEDGQEANYLAAQQVLADHPDFALNDYVVGNGVEALAFNTNEFLFNNGTINGRPIREVAAERGFDNLTDLMANIAEGKNDDFPAVNGNPAVDGPETFNYPISLAIPGAVLPNGDVAQIQTTANELLFASRGEFIPNYLDAHNFPKEVQDNGRPALFSDLQPDSLLGFMYNSAATIDGELAFNSILYQASTHQRGDLAANLASFETNVTAFEQPTVSERGAADISTGFGSALGRLGGIDQEGLLNLATEIRANDQAANLSVFEYYFDVNGNDVASTNNLDVDNLPAADQVQLDQNEFLLRQNFLNESGFEFTAIEGQDTIYLNTTTAADGTVTINDVSFAADDTIEQRPLPVSELTADQFRYLVDNGLLAVDTQVNITRNGANADLTQQNALDISNVLNGLTPDGGANLTLGNTFDSDLATYMYGPTILAQSKTRDDFIERSAEVDKLFDALVTGGFDPAQIGAYDSANVKESLNARPVASPTALEPQAAGIGSA